MEQYDYLIIGAGIAGAALACRLAPHGRVGLFEQEAFAGYHASGRSTATLVRSYGGPITRTLTFSSESFFSSPPEGFSDLALLRPRGNLRIGRREDRALLERDFAACSPLVPDLQLIGQAEALKLCPVLRPPFAEIALYEPGACDMDVEALLQGYLRAARRHGAIFHSNAKVIAINPLASGWRIRTANVEARAAILINAAGAWADEVARGAGLKGLGITPRRRTVVCIRPEKAPEFHHWPLVRNAQESFYFKPFNGNLLVTPADETPSPPCDSQAEEIDLATAMARLREATYLNARNIHSSWAGLRSFVSDDAPVIGFDKAHPGFFWAAGFGGSGVQTSPAASLAAAALLTSQPWPEDLALAGLTPELLSPSRLLPSSN